MENRLEELEKTVKELADENVRLRRQLRELRRALRETITRLNYSLYAIRKTLEENKLLSCERSYDLRQISNELSTEEYKLSREWGDDC